MNYKNNLVALSTATLLMFFSSSSIANNGKGLGHVHSHMERITESSVSSMLTGNVIDGMSTVNRHEENISFSFDARQLNPGNAYTLWIMNLDNPENCLNSCNCSFADFANPDVTLGAMGAMTGRVADQYGQLDMSTVINYNELPTGPGQVLVPNPVKNDKAHFMLVLRDHGPASNDPVILEQQLTNWAGGCSATNQCQDVVISDHKSPSCSVE